MDNARRDVDQLMREYGSQLLRLCTMLLRDASLAQDAVQDAFLQAYRRYGTWRGDSSAKTWLTAIAVNVCRDYLRSPWHRHVSMDRDVSDLPGQAADFTFPDNTVITEVMRLPVRYREVILLRYYQNMKQKDVAAALHLTDRAVRLRLHKANAILSGRLKEWYDEE